MNFLRLWTRKRMAPTRGEVWLLDLGMAEKVRPALIVSADFGDHDRALIGSEYEVPVSVFFLRPGAFLVQTSRHIQLCGRFAAPDR